MFAMTRSDPEKIGFSNISEAYKSLLGSDNKCGTVRSAIISDKPVYRNGETVYVTVFYYDFMKKKPESTCKSVHFASVVVKDNDLKQIARLDNPLRELSEEDKLKKEQSAITFEWKIPKDLAGGSYRILSQGTSQDEMRIFVLKSEPRQIALVGDWSQENAKAGDTIKGKLSLKMLTQSSPELNKATLTYTFSSNGEKLNSNSASFGSGPVEISFTVPQKFARSLIFSATAKINSETVTYQKEFLEPNFENIVLDFTIGNGRVAIGSKNTIYFVSWENKDRKLEVPVTEARLIKRIGSRSELVDGNIRSTIDGKGKFDISVTTEDLKNSAKFYFEVKYDSLNSKQYLAVDLDGKKVSPLSMTTKRLVESKESFDVEVNSKDYTGRALLAVINKGKVLKQKSFRISAKSSSIQKITLAKTGMRIGGVFTLSLFIPINGTDSTTFSNAKGKLNDIKHLAQNAYNSKNKVENIKGAAKNVFQRFTKGNRNKNDLNAKALPANIREQGRNAKMAGMRKRMIMPPFPSPSGQNKILYNGEEVQETEIFVIPSRIASASINISPNSIVAGDEFSYSIKLNTGCKECIQLKNGIHENDFKVLVDVIDESAFVEVEKSRESPSLFNKIFLESEVKNKDKIFFNAYKYIDGLFDASKRSVLNMVDVEVRLDMLLGNQGFRKLFFDPKNLEEFLKNRYDSSKYGDSRENLEKLLFSNQYSNGMPYGPVAFFRRGGMPNMAFADASPMMMNMAAPVAMMARTKTVTMEASISPPPPQDIPSPGPIQPDTKDKSSIQKQVAEIAENTVEIKKDNILHQSLTRIHKSGVNGKVKLPERVTNFLVRVQIVHESGIYGFSEVVVQPRRDFNLLADPPLYIFNDEVFDMQVSLENNQATSQSVSFIKPKAFSLEAKAKGATAFKVSLSPGNVPYHIEAVDSKGSKAISRIFAPAVVSPGIYRSGGKSGLISGKENSKLEFSETLPNSLVKGNNSLRVCYRNSALGLILDAIKTLNRQPSGCFEQASSTNFPLILAVKVIDGLPSTPELIKLRRDMIENIKKGVNLLNKYECKEGSGFEWFGKAPCHSTLSAYGLWQFIELDSLKISPPLFERSLLYKLNGFLANSRDEEGGFKITKRLDSLGNPEKEVSDMYITFVLSLRYNENKYMFKKQFDIILKQYQKFVSDKDSLDSYKLAILRLFMVNTENKSAAKDIATVLVSRQEKDTGQILKAKSSITKSSGLSLSIETTALTLMLLTRGELFEFDKSIELCLKYITSNMKGSAFPSTQATILSLMGISDYLKAFKQNMDSLLDFNIDFNGKNVGALSVKPGSLETTCKDISKQLSQIEEGGKSISVIVKLKNDSSEKGKYMISIDLGYYAEIPNSASDSPLKLNIAKSVIEGSVSYKVDIRNNKSEDVGMTVYEFMKPSCMDFNINDLDNLLLNKIVDNYELRENNSVLVFYWRGIKSNSSVHVSFSTRKRYQLNSCGEKTHSSYLYYDKEGSISFIRPV